MSTWNIKETKAILYKLHGKQQLEIIRPCLESVVSRLNYTRYHFQEYKRQLQENINSKLPEKDILEITWAPNQDMHLVFTKTDANVVATVQSLHCIIDTFANVVCYACGLNFGDTPLTVQKITAHSVVDKLKSKPNKKQIGEALNELSSNSDSLYLIALANHSKHRNIIPPVLHVHCDNKESLPYSMEFPSFTYKGKHYTDRKIEPFLEQIYYRLSKGIVECGIILNTCLSKYD
jgi:hypothetical protein